MRARPAHYAAAAKAYEASFCYAEGTPFWTSLVGWVADALVLESVDTLVDVGGGTGSFASALRTERSVVADALVVDPSEAMLAQAATRRGLQTVASGALPFFAERAEALRTGGAEPMDKILFKEVVHHFDAATFDSIATLMARTLRPGSGRMLIVTRPQEVEYPLWAAARRTWRENQPPASLYETALADAGFAVTTTERRFRWELPRDAWFDHVRARAWSTFAVENFDDDALAAGIAEAEHEAGDGEMLCFDEVMLFIEARLVVDA